MIIFPLSSLAFLRPDYIPNFLWVVVLSTTQRSQIKTPRAFDIDDPELFIAMCLSRSLYDGSFCNQYLGGLSPESPHSLIFLSEVIFLYIREFYINSERNLKIISYLFGEIFGHVKDCFYLCTRKVEGVTVTAVKSRNLMKKFSPESLVVRK